MDRKDAIGKHYRRQDAIGTTFCVSIDHQTNEGKMVTIRQRNSMQQELVLISVVKNIVLKILKFF